ncbi:isoprenoid biosynthesis enzyme family protein [Streptomyces rhizosphaericus]|uniref:hypothetical protein n=1 Tax=Streptomyces rhizosphaericus TaxID=114699 RepID=UPI003627CB4E
MRDGLAGGESEDPAVGPLLHTVSAHPGMRGRVEDFLDAAATELEFTGFATEVDYQRYVDAYALPAFMLIAGLIAGEDPATDYREACRGTSTAASAWTSSTTWPRTSPTGA